MMSFYVTGTYLFHNMVYYFNFLSMNFFHILYEMSYLFM